MSMYFASLRARFVFTQAIVAAAVLACAGSASAQLSEGPLSPGTLVNDSVAGTSVWINPAAAASSDNIRTTTGPGGIPSQYLKATSFGFSVPSPAQITGIEVKVERLSLGGTIVDSAVRIVKGGVVGASDRSLVGTWPLTDTVVTYGSSSDLWGTTWTPAEINSPGFGFAIAVTDSFDTAGIDHITVKVFYTLCAATPAAGCRAAGKSVLVINDKTPDAKDKLVWKWLKGDSTSTAEFADPVNSAVYSLCIYEAVTEDLIADATVPASATLWNPISTTGFKYLDKNASAAGVQKIIVKASIADKAKALFKGKGPGLPDPVPPLTSPVKVQLINGDTGICWEASYTTPNFKKNEAGKFKAITVTP